MRLPKGATSDGAVILPDIDVSTATLEAVNANSLKAYVPSGAKVPTGGTTGQVFTKSSNDDYAANWQTLSFASSSLVEAARIRAWFL